MAFNFPKNAANLTKITAGNGVSYTFRSGRWEADTLSTFSGLAPVNHTHAIPDISNLSAEISRLEGLISSDIVLQSPRVTTLENQVTAILNKPVATYSIIPNTSTSYNEGDVISFVVNTTNVPNNTTLYWSTSPNKSSDLSSVSYGSLVITNNTGGGSFTIVADQLTEGLETFQISIFKDVENTQLLATSGIITINDTSLSPPSRITRNLTISSDTFNYILAPESINDYVAGLTDVVLTVNQYVVVGSASTQSFSMTIAQNWHNNDTVKIVNRGLIAGAGGAGGVNFGGFTYTWNGDPSTATPGGNGGGAIKVRSMVSIENFGTIAGGGGGGGAQSNSTPNASYYVQYAGGGGGAGSIGGVGGNSGAYAHGQNGTTYTGGQAGIGYASLTGGAGGNLGEPGGQGATGTDGGSPGSLGGQPGPAVDLEGANANINWLVAGTIIGSII